MGNIVRFFKHKPHGKGGYPTHGNGLFQRVEGEAHWQIICDRALRPKKLFCWALEVLRRPVWHLSLRSTWCQGTCGLKGKQ